MSKLLNWLRTLWDKHRVPVFPCPGGRSFDEMAFFDKEVKPFLNRAAELCTAHKIPHLFWAVPRCVETEKGKKCARDCYLRSFIDNNMISEIALFSMVATGEMSLVEMANRILDATKKH